MTSETATVEALCTGFMRCAECQAYGESRRWLLRGRRLAEPSPRVRLMHGSPSVAMRTRLGRAPSDAGFDVVGGGPASVPGREVR